MIFFLVIYNVIHEYKNDITDTRLKEIINNKLYKIIELLEFNANYFE